MQELLELLVKTLVDSEDSVKVAKEETENVITFNVTVASDDLGKVIGKNGKTAESIRTILRSVATKEHKKIFVKFGE